MFENSLIFVSGSLSLIRIENKGKSSSTVFYLPIYGASLKIF